MLALSLAGRVTRPAEVPAGRARDRLGVGLSEWEDPSAGSRELLCEGGEVSI